MNSPMILPPSLAWTKTGADAPSFILRRPEGVFLNLSALPSGQAFHSFVDGLFRQGFRFEGLDYPCLLANAFPGRPEPERSGEVRLANGIVIFPRTRQALYKQCRLMDRGARAEYIFEAVSLEVSVTDEAQPELGETTRMEPTQLDFDEFVADMWCKGVQYGLDPSRFEVGQRATLAERLVIANELKPTPGCNAALKEEFSGLHRDNSPLIRDGKADLRRLTNRFPQIASGQRMIRKIPRKLGDVGYRVTGLLVEPAVPKDLNLEGMAGPGTRIERDDDGEYLVADMEGFLSIDAGSNRISVSEKIENRGGISAKTTGDLSLTVNEFVEHGEVQEGRRVDGRHMCFTAAVYGELVSDGGNLTLNDNLVGGSASSPGGRITIKRRASSARIEAPGGAIEVGYAENCQIVGQTVHIGEAINCDIVADVLTLGSVTGCAIAAQSVTIERTDSRKSVPTMVSVLVPDPQVLARQTQALQALIAQAQSLVDAKALEVKRASADPQVARVFAIKAMVQVGKVTLTEAQDLSFRQMQARFASALRLLEKLDHEKTALNQALQEQGQTLESLQSMHAMLSSGCRLTIHQVVGATLVQQMLTPNGKADFGEARGMDLHNVLRTHAPSRLRLFSGESGHVEWTAPQPPANSA